MTVNLTLYHPGDPHRDRVWRFIRERRERAGFTVIEGFSERGLYAARNVAARKAGDWRVAVFSDADYALREPSLAVEACAEVEQDEYVCMFDVLNVLSREQTSAFLQEGVPPGEVEERLAGIWLGYFAIGRALWEAVGGFDERFAGRAGQDVAFLHAAGTLGRQRRIAGDVFHLWHPPPVGRVYDDGLIHEYMRATGNPDEMRRVVAR